MHHNTSHEEVWMNARYTTRRGIVQALWTEWLTYDEVSALVWLDHSRELEQRGTRPEEMPQHRSEFRDLFAAVWDILDREGRMTTRDGDMFGPYRVVSQTTGPDGFSTEVRPVELDEIPEDALHASAHTSTTLAADLGVSNIEFHHVLDQLRDAALVGAISSAACSPQGDRYLTVHAEQLMRQGLTERAEQTGTLATSLPGGSVDLVLRWLAELERQALTAQTGGHANGELMVSAVADIVEILNLGNDNGIVDDAYTTIVTPIIEGFGPTLG